MMMGGGKPKMMMGGGKPKMMMGGKPKMMMNEGGGGGMMPKMMMGGGGMMPKMMMGGNGGGGGTPKMMMGGNGGNGQPMGGGQTPTNPPTPVPPAVSTDLGDRLLRTFLLFKQQPLTVADAKSQGFVMFTTGCTRFGFGYASGSGGPTKSNSVILYYTQGGQLAGFGSRMWGEAPIPLVDQGYWMDTGVGDDSFDIIVQTRDPTMICSNTVDGNKLGDRLVINGLMNIPTMAPLAESAGWVEGNCIPKMGIHHAYDLNFPSSQSWNASSLVPILPMYSATTGRVTAVLIASPDAQRIEPFGDWEGPFTNGLFCKNWCANTGCTFPGVTLWTTMHWLFEDPSTNTCAGARCSI
jgi:hypothetical protein